MVSRARSILLFMVFVLALTPMLTNWTPAYADPGNFSVTFDAPSVSAGQQDVPVYIHIDSNGSDISFAGCELVVDNSKAVFSHGLDDNGSFTSDFAGPNGAFDSGGVDEYTFFASVGAGAAVTAASDIETFVMFYDVDAGATGDIVVSFDTADTGNCSIQDETSTPLTLNGTSGTLNVSDITVTETSSSTDVVENGATDTYDVVLDAEPASNVTIDITDDAQTNVDVSSLVFTNANWDTPQTVTVSAEDDATLEGAHTGTVTMAVNGSSDPLYTGLSIGDITVNITDNDGLIVEFNNATDSDNEDTGGNLPEIVVSGGNTTGGSARSIDVTVTGGTATGGGDDYTFTDPETINIPAGDYTSPQTLSLSGLSIGTDTDVESDETIIFGLTNPSAGLSVDDADGSTTTESANTYTINNDDGLLVELTAASASDAENTGGNMLQLVVSGADTTGGSAETIDVNILGSSTADGADYTFGGATISVPADDYTTPQNISIGLTIDDDATVEGDDTIDLSLGSPSAGISIGDASGGSGTNSTATYTINNDDQLTAELTDTTANDTETSGSNVPAILIDGTSDVATTIRIDDQGTGSATSGGDYTLTDPVDVAVPAATYDGLIGTSIAVPLSITDDQIIETNETVDFTLSAPASNIGLADVDGADGTESTHTYTINDDDSLNLEFDVATDSANEDDGYTPQLRVGGAILASSQTVEVTVTGGTATGGGDDFSFTSPTTITIPVGDYSSGTTAINITGLSVAVDSIIESAETIIFGLQNESAGVTLADADAADGNESVLTFTINNDDGLLVEFNNASDSDNEDTGGSLPQVVVSGADTTGGSAESVDVTVTGGTATGGGDDYTFTDPETISIPAGDYSAPQVISLSGLSIETDTDVESNETIIFGLTNLSSNLSVGDADGSTTTESANTYTINNDDGLLVELSSTSGSDDENTGANTPTLIVSGIDTTGGSAETIDVNILGSSTADGADYTSLGTTITIPADDYTTPQTISIGLSIDGDTVVEADDIIDLNLSGPSAGVLIGDADGASGIEDTHTYTILNDDDLTAELTTTSASGDEASNANVPQLLVDGVSDIAASVTLDDLGTGSATISTDYNFTDPYVINIPAGTYDGTTGTALAIGLSIVDDTTVENNETIVFALSATNHTVLADVDGTDGTESALTYTILNDDENTSDTDNDGITDSVEDAGPNGGDANGDGTLDSAQANVTSIINGVTNAYTVLEISTACTTIASFNVIAEASQVVLDDAHEYPYGLNDFTLNCASAGDSGTVSILLDQEYDTTDWVLRKLNRNTSSYGDLSGATFTTRDVNGTSVTEVTYSVTDGSSNDEDGVVNAIIIDPVGISEGSILAETGTNPQLPMAIGALLVAAGVTLPRISTRKYSRKS